MSAQIVKKIEPGMDRTDVLVTTYQMRNFYRQFGDGFFDTLDIMNLIQHHQIAQWCKVGYRVLDVCCGRGLLLPFLRYNHKDIASYTGIDIEPQNARFLKQRVTDGKPIEAGYYPFPVSFVEGNVAEMDSLLSERYHLIVYTSSIEHMHPDLGQRSLMACRKVIEDQGVFILTTPRTVEGQSGYETRYAAHVYEWSRSELQAGLEQAGFQIVAEYGLVIGKRELDHQMTRLGYKPLLDHLNQFIPTPWLNVLFAPLFPQQASEIAFICKPIG